MKRIFISICAMVLSLTASAQILSTQPEGQLIKNMYRSSKSVTTADGIVDVKYEGLVSSMVIGNDGSLYVKNPLSYLASNSWLKLTKVSDQNYKATLPQDIYKDNGEDEFSSDERIFTLNRLSKSEDTYNVVSTDKNNVNFTWDGKTLKMADMSNNSEIIGIVSNNEWNNKYGDWNITIETLNDQVITPPTSAKEQQFLISYKSLDPFKTDDVQRRISGAIDGNDIYLKGLFENSQLENVWVKITKNNNKAIFATNQYLGIGQKKDFNQNDAISDNTEYHIYAGAFKNWSTTANEIEFNVDGATNVLSTEGIIKISLGKSSSENNNTSEDEKYEEIRNLVITPFSENGATPMKPELEFCSSRPNYENTKTLTTISFRIYNKDTEDKYLDSEKMHYNIYLNDNTTPYTFKKEKYPNINDNAITDIPFEYHGTDNKDIEVHGDQRSIQFDEDNITSLKVVLVYTLNGKKYQSEPLIAKVVATKNDTNGIEGATFNKNVTEKYYTLDGRQLQHLQKGLNIVKTSNGTTRKVIIK